MVGMNLICFFLPNNFRNFWAFGWALWNHLLPRKSSLALITLDWATCWGMVKESAFGKASVWLDPQDWEEESDVWKLLWFGFTPSKVQTFSWMVLKNKLGVKDELKKRMIIDDDDLTCSFCGTGTETLTHLFFHCHFSWTVWNRWVKLWDLMWVFPTTLLLSLSAWKGLSTGQTCPKLWLMGFFVIIWSIGLWEMTLSSTRGNPTLRD